jgi:hypothetical protein
VKDGPRRKTCALAGGVLGMRERASIRGGCEEARIQGQNQPPELCVQVGRVGGVWMEDGEV